MQFKKTPGQQKKHRNQGTAILKAVLTEGSLGITLSAGQGGSGQRSRGEESDGGEESGRCDHDR